jgi:hypothetical protein
MIQVIWVGVKTNSENRNRSPLFVPTEPGFQVHAGTGRGGRIPQRVQRSATRTCTVRPRTKSARRRSHVHLTSPNVGNDGRRPSLGHETGVKKPVIWVWELSGENEGALYPASAKNISSIRQAALKTHPIRSPLSAASATALLAITLLMCGMAAGALYHVTRGADHILVCPALWRLRAGESGQERKPLVFPCRYLVRYSPQSCAGPE